MLVDLIVKREKKSKDVCWALSVQVDYFCFLDTLECTMKITKTLNYIPHEKPVLHVD